MVKSTDLDAVREDEESAQSEDGEERLEASRTYAGRKKHKRDVRRHPAKRLRATLNPSTRRPLRSPQPTQPIDRMPPLSESVSLSQGESEEPLDYFYPGEQVPPSPMYLESDDEDKPLWDWVKTALDSVLQVFHIRPL